jgi:hypothetical protein
MTEIVTLMPIVGLVTIASARVMLARSAPAAGDRLDESSQQLKQSPLGR